MKVGYLGPKGTFSYEACKNAYDSGVEKVPYKTIKETILALQNDEVSEIIVPIENSLQGCVTETIDTLIENEDLKIIGEKVLKINQNLMAKEKYKLEEITEIYSHPQALAQCRNYLQSNLKNATTIEVSSTALSAKEVSQKEFSACICNLECLEEYNLKLLASNIQDNNLNETKFWQLSKSKKDILNADIITMLFSTKHEPGALYKALSIFNKNNLNLTKIESRPAKTKLGEYYFLIDIEIHNKNYEKALEELKNVVVFFRILGKYKKDEVNKYDIRENEGLCSK